MDTIISNSNYIVYAVCKKGHPLYIGYSHGEPTKFNLRSFLGISKSEWFDENYSIEYLEGYETKFEAMQGKAYYISECNTLNRGLNQRVADGVKSYVSQYYYNQRYYYDEGNLKRRKVYEKRRYAIHKDERLDYCHKYYAEHRDELKAKAKERYYQKKKEEAKNA